MSNADLQKQAGFSANIRLQSIEKICNVLDCRVDDILEFVSDEVQIKKKETCSIQIRMKYKRGDESDKIKDNQIISYQREQ